MGTIPVDQMAERVAQLLEERLHLRGQGLAEKLRRGGRLLPRKVRAAAEALVEAQELAQNPRLIPMIDTERVSEAYDLCVGHLRQVGRGERLKGAALEIAGSIAFRLLAVFAILVAVLVLRGFL